MKELIMNFKISKKQLNDITNIPKEIYAFGQKNVSHRIFRLC